MPPEAPLRRIHWSHARQTRKIAKAVAQMNVAIDYYAVLGVRPSVSSTGLTAAYRALLKRNHPDVCAKAAAKQNTEKIIEAYRVLTNANTRRAYDAIRETQTDEDQSFRNEHRIWSHHRI